MSRSTPYASPLRDSAGNDRSATVSQGGGYNAPRYEWKGNTASRPFYHGQEIDHYHQGVDLLAQSDAKVYGIGRGRVVSAFPPGGGYCKIGLVLQLEDGAFVVYCDLGKRRVGLGATVDENTVVGEVGDRGFVHIAIERPRGTFINPAGLFPFTVRTA